MLKFVMAWTSQDKPGHDVKCVPFARKEMLVTNTLITDNLVTDKSCHRLWMVMVFRQRQPERR